MSDMERLTITLTPELAESVKRAVKSGDYASSSEIVREALRDWKVKRTTQEYALQELRSDIQAGLADIRQGQVTSFEPEDIKHLGRQIFNKTDPSP